MKEKGQVFVEGEQSICWWPAAAGGKSHGGWDGGLWIFIGKVKET